MSRTNEMDTRSTQPIHRILVVFTVGALVLGAALTITAIVPLYGELASKEKQRLGFTAHSRTLAVDQYLNRLKSVAEQVTSRTKARLELEAYNRGEVDLSHLQEFSGPILSDALTRSDAILGIVRLDARQSLAVKLGHRIPEEHWEIPNPEAQTASIRGPITLDGESRLVVGAPILDRARRRVGTDIVLFHTEQLVELVNDYSGLGKSGETVLASEDSGDEVRILFPMRPGVRAVSVDALAPAVREALAQNRTVAEISGGGESEDLVVAYEPVGHAPWALLVKMNSAEVLADIRKLVGRVVGIVIAVIAAGAVGMWLLLRPLVGKVILQTDELEEVIESRTEDLKRSNEELDKFAYAASHDLKSPLRAVRNLAEWIDEDAGDRLPEPSKKDLATLRNRVTRMERLLDSLLEYSRIGRKEDIPEEIDVGQLITDLKETLDVPPNFTIEVTPGLPSVNTPRGALNRVFGNLISNAIKHHEGDEGHVLVSHRESGQFHEFSIADNGPGIPEEFRDRVFTMFQTLRPRDEVEGTGMGLALVRKTVESHGGRIELESDGKTGATFRFTWPRRTEHDD